MHELSVTKNVLQLVIRHAEANKARRVVGVKLEIGEMRDIVEDLMQKCFLYLARGTVAEGAALKINVIPLTCNCRACNEVFPVDWRKGFDHMSCPKCGGASLAPYTGQEFFIKEIDVV
ncbi:hydrogenase maturation nickel metallochaperone HypA [Pelotomaculum propionicicum]|uniref:hydrogenase maturation nickel metallochaperone HypA n=1 Tax=Pelotomaculum propionicicum TaxID=258475 RepID=UPI003B78BA73